MQGSKKGMSRAPKDHINTRILPTMIYGIPFTLALESECEILLFRWSFGPLLSLPYMILALGRAVGAKSDSAGTKKLGLKRLDWHIWCSVDQPPPSPPPMVEGLGLF